MKQYMTLIAALFIIISTTAIHANTTTTLLQASDWEAEASDAHNEHIPVMVVFSSNECGYCDRLKGDFLKPLMESGELTKQVHINEFNIDRGGKVTDFDGDRVRSRIFVDRYKIYATPTVLLLDYDGNPLTKPLVGFNNVSDYKEYLTAAIQDAHKALIAN